MKDEGDVAFCGQLMGYIYPVGGYTPGIRFFEARDDPQKRCFARTCWSQDDQELFGVKRDSEISESACVSP